MPYQARSPTSIGISTLFVLSTVPASAACCCCADQLARMPAAIRVATSGETPSALSSSCRRAISDVRVTPADSLGASTRL